MHAPLPLRSSRQHFTEPLRCPLSGHVGQAQSHYLRDAIHAIPLSSEKRLLCRKLETEGEIATQLLARPQRLQELARLRGRLSRSAARSHAKAAALYCMCVLSRFVLARSKAIRWLRAASLLNPCIQTIHWQGGDPIACWSRRPTEMTQGLVSLSCPSFFPRCLLCSCVHFCMLKCSSVCDGICRVFKLSCASTNYLCSSNTHP